MDKKTLEFLQAMRRQGRGNEQGGEDRLNVYSGDAAFAVGMDAGGPEYQAAVAKLERAGYILPHPDYNLARQGVYRITPEGIARADQG